MSNQTRIGIVGTGMIAKVIAEAINETPGAVLRGVAGRTLAKSQKFVAEGNLVGKPYSNWQDLIKDSDIDAIYIGTPTVVKHEIASAALENGKHLLVDKPLGSLTSAQKLTAMAADFDLALLDATHFVHHPRTAAIKSKLRSIGPITGIRSAFYFPFADKSNIRFNRSAEPTGGLGDLAWYNMRAVVEFLKPGAVEKIASHLQKDSETGAVVRAAGFIGFSGGKTATWDVGYTAGAMAMDLEIMGSEGIISVDDFVLNWENSFAFQNADLTTGYRVRTGMTPSPSAEFVAVASPKPAHVKMLEAFCLAIAQPQLREPWFDATTKTQALLEAIAADAERIKKNLVTHTV